MKSYITAGQLAILASTTKRTILFYDQKGVLNPTRVNSKKYRYYGESQVLDYQKILLLTTMGIPLKEIKNYLRRKGDLTKLFNNKKPFIKKEIKRLAFNLSSLERFLHNLKNNGTMVNPEIKILKPFGVYYIEKIGSYAEIESYCQELAQMFEKKGKNFTTLAIFENPTYQPKESSIKIGALASKGMKINRQYKDLIKYLKFNPGKVITYTHNGSGSLLSLFWKELEKYCALHHLKIRKETPDFEIYRQVNEEDPTKQFFEIYLPIN
ncbi:MerR family transcriptional regulator [Candidatus Gottesmanbacteria bacterium]|nr:MerR family transcriptional regulator [Candidatus Gottesmanbacteria bacterium]